MTEVDEHGRPEPPLDADETTMTLAYLDHQRATLAWKGAGLDADGLGAALPPTTMTLGGLLKHMTYVEDQWFSRALHGNEPSPPWDAVDWAADNDWDWHSAALDEPDGRAPNLRWIVLHMIEEYARHVGHADLLREAVDGQTGE